MDLRWFGFGGFTISIANLIQALGLVVSPIQLRGREKRAGWEKKERENEGEDGWVREQRERENKGEEGWARERERLIGGEKETERMGEGDYW